MTEPKQKVRYNYEFLQKYCEENNITLLKDYSNEKVNRDTKIEAKCVTESCDEFVNKNFRYYIDHGVYCKICSVSIIKNKIKKTCLEKYGVDTPLQSEIVKEKIKQTFLDKYGVEHPSKIDEVKEKSKKTCLKKYGVEYTLQDKEIRLKGKKTIFKKYGVEYATQSNEIQEKTIKTNLEKYGCKRPSQNAKVREKVKQTCLERYGVEHPNQLQYFMDKMSKNAYKLKDYILPSGNIIKVQGYEHYAYNELLNLENIKEEDILNGASNVPEIWYYKDDIKKRHYVDIYIPSQNRCIEVKSTWTAEKKQDNIFLKQQAGKELGYNYEIWVYNGKGEKIECHK